MATTDLLILTQWLSPAFPVGAYAYSHGLETAIASGEVSDAETMRDWLSDILRFGAGRADATLLSATHRGEDVARLTALARALAGSRERSVETEAPGAAFVSTLNAMTGGDALPMPYPVAMGLAARGLDLPTSTVAALYLQAVASNLISIAVRAVPLGQSAGQRLLADLLPLIETVAGEAATAKAEDIVSAAPRGDLLAMQHETLNVRIYRT